MSITHSPSRLVCDALGFAPVTSRKLKAASACSMCGVEMAAGDDCAPFSPATTFNDYPSLKMPGTGVICGHCAALWTKPRLMGLQSFVATEKEIYDLGDPAIRSAAILSPPEPPFLFALGTMKKPLFQHLIWRTPISLSKTCYTLRLGTSLMQIRPGQVRDAVAASQRLIEAYRQVNKRSKANTPFVYERSGNDLAFGQIPAHFMALGQESVELADAISFLQSQSRSTLWAAGQVLIVPPSTTEFPILNTEKMR